MQNQLTAFLKPPWTAGTQAAFHTWSLIGRYRLIIMNSPVININQTTAMIYQSYYCTSKLTRVYCSTPQPVYVKGAIHLKTMVRGAWSTKYGMWKIHALLDGADCLKNHAWPLNTPTGCSEDVITVIPQNRKKIRDHAAAAGTASVLFGRIHPASISANCHLNHTGDITADKQWTNCNQFSP